MVFIIGVLAFMAKHYGHAASFFAWASLGIELCTLQQVLEGSSWAKHMDRLSSKQIVAN